MDKRTIIQDIKILVEDFVEDREWLISYDGEMVAYTSELNKF